MLGRWLLDNVSIFHVVYWTTAAGLLIVQALLARARRTPSSAPGDTKLEVVWAIVPALFLVCLGLLSHRSLNENAPTRAPIALQETTDREAGLTAVSRTADGGAR